MLITLLRAVAIGTLVASASFLTPAGISVAEELPRYIEPNEKAGMSAAVVVGDVPLVHTRAFLPLDAQGKLAAREFTPQFERVLDNLAAALAEAKSSLESVVKLNIYVAADKHVSAAQAVLAKRFSGRQKPAVSYVVTPLSVEGALVGADAVATTSLDPGRAVKQLLDSAIMPGGSRIYVAGQAERWFSVRDATRNTLESLRNTLRHFGRRDEDMVQLKVFVDARANKSDIEREVDAFFGDRPGPPLVLVEWQSSAQTPVEIEVVAWGGANNPGGPVEYATPPGMTASPVYSRVALVHHSRMIYVSGLYASRVEGADPTKPESGEREVKEVFTSLERILQAAGSDLRHLAKATYYVSTDAASKKLNELRPRYYDPKRPPAASKAQVSSVGQAGLGLTLDMIAVPAVDAEKPEYGPAEFGHGLSAADAAAGWLSLFDGQSDFGWQDAQVKDGGISGGSTTVALGNCELRATFESGGKVRLGERDFEVTKGDFKLAQTKAKPGVVERLTLGEGVRLAQLSVRPLGLTPLLNGTDLTGWKRIDHPTLAAEKRPTWQVENGALRAVGGPGCVEYQGERYGDFVLQIDVRTRVRHANGGLFFRAIPGDFMNGYEAQVFNRAVDGDPGRPAVWSTGALDDRQNARRLVSRDGQFYRMTVIARGNRLATWINGFQQIDFVDTRPPHENARNGLRTEPGVLQLQAHDTGTDVEFKNLGVAKW